MKPESLNEKIKGSDESKNMGSKPKKFKVYIFDNSETPRMLVQDLLMTVFKHSLNSSNDIISEIETEGLATVGEYVYEIAEQKVAECIAASNRIGTPLEVTVDSE